MSKGAEKNEYYGKARVVLHIFIFILISIALSIFIFKTINDYNKGFNDDTDFVKAKATEMIERRKFEPIENVAVRTCNLDIINDTLTLEVSYKSTNYSVEAKNYSKKNIDISFTRLDTHIESNPILLYIFCCIFSFIFVGLLIFILYFIVHLFSYFINVIIVKFKLYKLRNQ